jgi:hypothetical protein
MRKKMPVGKSRMRYFAREEREQANCSRKNGAGDRDRTGDIQLGKLAFYR